MTTDQGFHQQEFGSVPSPAEYGLQQRAMVRRFLDGVTTTEPAVVVAYDGVNQRVDVRLKNYPDRGVIRGVPIGRDILVPLVAGDVGILLFMRSDSRRSFDNKDILKAQTPVNHAARGTVFVVPRILLGDSALPSALTSDAEVDLAKDTVLPLTGGSFLIARANGDVILKTAGQFRVGPVGEASSGWAAAARQGDAVSGGAISAGSGKVRIG